MTPLKEFSDRTGVAVIVVHHIRKMAADDVCETISGTNGLLGAVDGALILNNKKDFASSNRIIRLRIRCLCWLSAF